jgi:O-antigen biosynthesis protein WbqP
MKRLFDIVVASAVILLSIPIMLLAALAIFINDGVPILFQQTRVGKMGVKFTCYKFRTMKQNVGDLPSHHVDTAVITTIGRSLRRYKIDELPQLFNVLNGTMSLVGPRPCLPVQTELVDLRSKNKILSVLPGITGLSQIRKIDMSTPEKLVESDKEYIQKQGLLLDFRILAATFFGQGFKVDAALSKHE